MNNRTRRYFVAGSVAVLCSLAGLSDSRYRQSSQPSREYTSLLPESSPQKVEGRTPFFIVEPLDPKHRPIGRPDKNRIGNRHEIFNSIPDDRKESSPRGHDII